MVIEGTQQRESLDLSNYVSGLERSQVDSSESTDFVVIYFTSAKFKAQVEWLKAKFEAWAGSLAGFSDFKVIESRVSVGDDYSHFQCTQVDKVFLELKVRVPGRLVFPEELNPDLAKIIISSIQKFLARDFEEKYPLNFSPHECLFAEDVADIIIFRNTQGQLGWHRSEIEVIAKDTGRIFVPELMNICKTFNARLTGSCFPREEHDGYIRLHLFYNQPISLDIRKKLERQVIGFLASRGVHCYPDI